MIPTTASTPGYNRRLLIFFNRDRRGKKLAFRWSPGLARAFRMPLAEAEQHIAAETALQIDGHPLRPR